MKTANKRVRLLRDDDIPVLAEILARKSQQLGIEFWMPPLRESRVTFVLEVDGQVTGALVFNDVVEMTMVGDTPSVVSGIMEAEDKVRLVLDREGVENMVSFVPKELISEQRKSGMQRIMERLSFRRIDQNYACFEGEVYGSR